MKRFYFIFFISLITIIISITYWQKNYGKYISTDNAYIRGSITNISSRIEGYVATVPGVLNTRVQKGDILVKFEEEPFLSKYEIALAEYEAAEAKISEINSLLKSNRKIKGIVIPSSRASNIIELIDSNIRSEIKVVGFDTTPSNISALRKGKITFLISQKSFNQGYKSIITMVNYLIHKVKPDLEIPTPLEIVTKENVEFIEYDMRHYDGKL